MSEATQVSDSETGSPPINLHDVESLQKIVVRDGLTLRPLRSQDSKEILSILDADPTIRDRVTVASRMTSPETVSDEVNKMETDPGLIRYAITDENDKCIGLVSFWLDPGFFGQAPLPNTYGFGYFIDPGMRRQGIVTGSVSALMAVAQQNLTVEGFTAFCEDGNQDSISVLTSLGFQPTEQTYPEPTHGWNERQYIKQASVDV